VIDTIVGVATIVLPGLVVLGGLAWMIGRVDAGARNSAWRRIADARREPRDQERNFVGCLDGHPCPDCPIRKYLRDHPAG
jgi:hypothetical protein